MEPELQKRKMHSEEEERKEGRTRIRRDDNAGAFEETPLIYIVKMSCDMSELVCINDDS